MAVGLCRVGLSPAAFWAMTPKEFSAVVKGAFAEPETPLGRARLDALMRVYPDR
jgi:uncharacterized phage protein (TIGR02216 family)